MPHKVGRPRSNAARSIGIGAGVRRFCLGGILLATLTGCANEATVAVVSPGESPSLTPSPIESPTESPAPSCQKSAQTKIDVVVRYFDFNVRCLVAPAGKRLTVTFMNDDLGISHNFSIHTPESTAVFMGDVAYPRERFSFMVPPLDAGQYVFQCDIHPEDMSGLLLVES